MLSPASALRAGLRTSLALIVIGVAAWAGPQGEKRTLLDFDKRATPAPAAASPDKSAAAAQLRGRLREPRVELDAVSEAPKFVGSPHEFLTGPGGEGHAVPKARMQTRAVNEPHREVKAFLEEYKGLYGHGAEVLNAAQVKRDYTNQHNGLRSVVWQQQVDGVPVFGAILQAHTTKRGELVNVASTFQPNPTAAANRGTPQRAARLAAPAISAVEAVAIAARNIGETVQATDLASTDAPIGAEKKQGFRAAALRGATVHFVWLPMDKGSSRLCWEVVLTGQKTGEMYRLLIDATTGEAQVRNCLTNYISEASYRVFTGDSPTPFQPGHATPSSAQPAEVPRTLVTLSALDTTASPNGWIDDGVTETRGNNVDAHLDLNNDNVADTPRPQGSGLNSRVFDFPLDLTQAPSTYRDAAVTQLFYWCNWMHDKLYQLGFNEASGNFQLNNFGRGGAGNDAVQADAQDGGGTDNANFSTPPDGSAGRMQMYVFSGPTPDRDGSLDAPIVLHEYTHGLSNRLVGGGAGISALASQGMGEGWSDFYSLALLTKAGDDVNGNYIEGGYATLGFGGLTQNYYYGIRRYPYTTDMAKNPLTFRDIDPTQASLHNGIPRSPVIGTSASEVHNSGEVWCVTLWEARANLIAKYGFAIGNQLILQLVTDGMKLSAANPNFIQARDAIIQADLVNNAGANRNELWAAFAKRGMGASATAPSSSTTSGVVESFDLPDDLGVTPAVAFTTSGPVGGPFSPTSTSYTLRNNGAAAINWTATKTAAWLTLFPASGSLNPGATTTVTVSLNAAANSLPAAILGDTVVFTNTGSGRTLPRAVNFYVGQPDYFTELFDTTNNDNANQSFTFTPSASADAYTVVREPVTTFPSDMTTGTTTISMTDDSSVLVTLSGVTVKLYGTTYSSFYVGSNGYITFGSSDIQWTESFTNHFAKPRIAGLFRDLNPPVLGGSVKRRQFADRVAVAWQSVREYGTALANNFMIEMFFDGRIRITMLNIASTKGLIGLSRGTGEPAGFTQSNFSGYPLPTLGATLPASATEGAGGLANQGSVTLSSPTAVARTITLTSSDPTAVTVPASVTLPAEQTSVTFTPTILDDTKINGTRAVTITASTTGLTSATRTFDVLDNENTSLALTLPNLSEGDNATGTVTISGTLTTNLVVALSSANPARLSVPASVTIPAGATSAPFPATGVNNTLADGTASVLVTASAAGFTDASRTVSVEDDDAHHFVIAPITGPKIRGAPFNVTISAVTVNGLPVPSYTGTVYLNTLTGVPITPPTLTLTGGTVTAAISAGAFGNGVILRATDANWRTSASNAFDVTFGPLDHFAWDAVGTQTIGIPFPARVTALDVAGNTVADYTGTAALDCGTPGNRTVPLSPATTGNFVAGVWSGSLSAGQIVDCVTLGAADGAATGESGSFNVLGIPVLGVTPADPWSAAGNFAGPFVPPSRTYTLTNNGSGILAWSVTTPADWLTFSATSGTLAAGASTTVTTTVAAPNTDPGTHAEDITFANTTNGLGTATRGAVLTVNLPPPALAWLPAFNGGTSTTLAWGPVAGAQWFEAQCSSDIGFTNPTSSGFVATTNHTFTGLGDGRHYYRVRSRRVNGAAVFDSVWSPLQTSHQAASGPAVIVTSPTLTTQPALTVNGLAFDAAGIASLTVNGTAATSADGFAHWTASGVGLAPGSNTLTILTTSTSFAPVTTTTNWNVYLATLTTDFDHDGLPDLWEIQNGLGYDSATGNSGPLGDLSGNGVSNLLKYALNLDPLSPALIGLPTATIEVNPADSARYLTFRYRRLLAPGSLQYQIETTSDLLDWTTTAADFEELAPVVPNADGLTETVTIRVKPAIDSPTTPARSVRLRVLAP
ncbi:MAG: M36 family metallopeptidase [Chthoniobacter sp.]|nr:M36 family metallopeptidase [Chthoniobacter sp.]